MANVPVFMSWFEFGPMYVNAPLEFIMVSYLYHVSALSSMPVGAVHEFQLLVVARPL